MGSDEGGPQSLENVFNNALALTLEDVAHIARHILVHLLARQEGLLRYLHMEICFNKYYPLSSVHIASRFLTISQYLLSRSQSQCV